MARIRILLALGSPLLREVVRGSVEAEEFDLAADVDVADVVVTDRPEDAPGLSASRPTLRVVALEGHGRRAACWQAGECRTTREDVSESELVALIRIGR